MNNMGPGGMPPHMMSGQFMQGGMGGMGGMNQVNYSESSDLLSTRLCSEHLCRVAHTSSAVAPYIPTAHS